MIDPSRPVWRTSSYSNGTGACVELAAWPGGVVAIRDSKNRSAGAAIVSRAALRALLAAVQTGELDAR